MEKPCRINWIIKHCVEYIELSEKKGNLKKNFYFSYNNPGSPVPLTDMMNTGTLKPISIENISPEIKNDS